MFKHRVKVSLHENKGKRLIGYEDIQFIKAPMLTKDMFVQELIRMTNIFAGLSEPAASSVSGPRSADNSALAERHSL